MPEVRLCAECPNPLPTKRKRRFCCSACAFWAQYDRSAGPDACWPWTGNLNKDNYGNASGRLCEGRRSSAHRHAYRLSFGDPGPLHVLHRCDNTRCGNPAHLFLGTHRDNMLDAWAKGRPVAAAPGVANRNAKLSDAAVAEIRAGRARDAELASLFGVHVKTVKAARTGATWRHVRHVLPEDEAGA
jgi:hypothetical protein